MKQSTLTFTIIVLCLSTIFTMYALDYLVKEIAKVRTTFDNIQGQLETVQHFANSQNDYMEHLKFEKDHLTYHIENLSPDIIKHLEVAHGIKVKIK